MPQVDIALPSTMPAELQELIHLAPMPGLDEAPRCAATGKRIESLLLKKPQLSGSVSEAGLWLLAGDLQRSHEVSQALPSPEGSFWHGIMHRREGDFWNAKYWFRKVGKHSVFEQLAGSIRGMEAEGKAISLVELFSATKLPEALVDECERSLASKTDHAALLQRICWREWQFLFHYGWD